MDTQKDTKWVSIDELATHYRQHRRTIQRWIASGAPVHRPGGRPLIDFDEFDEWVRSK
ncbi:MAG: hypothetical protein JWN99_2512 [Ilumatobacteraceae bacterium]|nr:hypothetical protein [Ilumatobacteraceae bacterium]